MAARGPILLTRAQQDSEILARKIEALGLPCLIAPVFEVRPTNCPPPDELGVADGIIVTSEKAVSYLYELPDAVYSKPTFAIGERTLKELGKTNFRNIFCAHSDSEKLLRLIKCHCPLPSIGLIHAGGINISPQFRQRASEENIPIIHWPVYEAAALYSFAENVVAALKEGHIDIVVFYSARTARIFEEICDAMDVTACLSHTQALCLAPSVVKSLRRTVWKEIHVSDKPTETAILDHLVKLKSGGEL